MGTHRHAKVWGWGFVLDTTSNMKSFEFGFATNCACHLSFALDANWTSPPLSLAPAHPPARPLALTRGLSRMGVSVRPNARTRVCAGVGACACARATAHMAMPFVSGICSHAPTSTTTPATIAAHARIGATAIVEPKNTHSPRLAWLAGTSTAALR